jgi:hypothetical protein
MAAIGASSCPFCRSPAPVDLFEVWGREFLLDACCEAMQQHLSEMDEGELAGIATPIMRDYGVPARRLVSDDTGTQQLIDFGLSLTDIDFATATAFVGRHHAHHRPSIGWKWGHAVHNGDDLVGVCSVGRPVARMIDATTTVEVTRLCVRRDLPRALSFNACSMLYGAAAREARRRGYQRVITYTLLEESGASLMAAGWQREAKTRGGSWSRRSRQREDVAPTGRKWRWSRALVAGAG